MEQTQLQRGSEITKEISTLKHEKASWETYQTKVKTLSLISLTGHGHFSYGYKDEGSESKSCSDRIGIRKSEHPYEATDPFWEEFCQKHIDSLQEKIQLLEKEFNAL